MIVFGENETFIKTVRKHWLFFVTELALFVFLALLPFSAYALFADKIISIVRGTGIVSGNIGAFLAFCYEAYLLLLWLVVCLLWTDYYLDVWIVTDQRIVDIEQKGLFNRTVSEFRLDMIQDVTVEVPSLIATMCSYGNIKVQTASEISNFAFQGISRPQETRNLIMELHHKAVDKPREVTIAAGGSVV